MRFETPAVVEEVVWTMKLADYARSLNRARINDLFNGLPPYSELEARENNIAVNVNFLESTKLGHDARRQFANAFTKPGNFFVINDIDRGPVHKRKEWAVTMTRNINRAMKRSLPYYEAIRSTFANVVLHGVGPVVWDDRESWVPDPVGMEDVLVPANTYLTMKNLPFFAIFRPYTALQLWRLTTGPKVDKAWNIPLVKQCIEYANSNVLDFGLPNSEIYSPEKLAERFKSDSGLYSTDSVPTIDCWDFYFFNDEGKHGAGWNRRIILDATWQLGTGGIAPSKPKAKDLTSKVGVRGQFIYDSGDRVYATKREQISHFQFGDLSAVAPFRYHSVRSLGFLLFAVCHLQNRLRCKFNDALFEHMLQYFRVRNLDEVERALKINLVEKGYIDETVQFIPQAERWQVNAGLIQMGLTHNRELMGQNASSYVQDYDFGRERAGKTATEVMAEVNSTTALVSAALAQAYEYQRFQYYEIARRFSKKHSTDEDVRKFRLKCLKDGVPEEVLNDHECWEIEPERVMGSGNKMLEMATADRLMAARNLYDPEPQREILRDFTLAITDDPGRTDRLVPRQPVRVTDSVHDAQLTSAALMMGLRVDIKTGMNHIEYVETMLGEMQLMLQKIMSAGGANPNQIIGLQNMAQHISGHIEIIAKDTGEKQRVKQYGDALGQIMNQVKALAQQMQQRMQAQQQRNGGLDPKDAAKIQATQLMAEVKAEAKRESNAQATAQRQTRFELEAQRDAAKHAAELEKQMAETQIDIAAKDAETAASILRDGANNQNPNQ